MAQSDTGTVRCTSLEDLFRIYEEEDHKKPVYSKKDVPNSYESITPEWLSDVLSYDSTVRVKSFSFGERDDGSANRRRINLEYEDGVDTLNLPKSVFCKLGEVFENRVAVGLSGVALAEVNFYNSVRGRLDIDSPTSIYSKFNQENCGFMIMLKDLDGLVDFCDENTVLTFEQADSQMRLLGKLHGSFYESDELGGNSIPFKTWQSSWKLLMDTMPQWPIYCGKAFLDSKDLMPERLYLRADEIWPATEASVSDHDNLPRTLIHCDTHLKNWYIDNDDSMGLADWQVVSIGHWSRDVIYAMTTSLSITQRRNWGDRLLKTYLKSLLESGGPEISESDAWNFMRRQIFSALAFWTITYRPAPGMPSFHPESSTREFLKRLYSAIDDLDALDAF